MRLLGVLQAALGLLAIVGLMFWASARHEDKRWRPIHDRWREFLRSNLRTQGVWLTDLLDKRVWHGRRDKEAADGGWLWDGSLSVGVYLDTTFSDLRALELELLRLLREFGQGQSLRPGRVEIVMDAVRPEYFRGDSAPPGEEIGDEPPEGELGIDIAERTMKRFVAEHLVRRLGREQPGHDILRQPDPADSATRSMRIVRDRRFLSVGLAVENDLEAAEELERRLSSLLGSHFEIIFTPK